MLKLEPQTSSLQGTVVWLQGSGANWGWKTMRPHLLASVMLDVGWEHWWCGRDWCPRSGVAGGKYKDRWERKELEEQKKAAGTIDKGDREDRRGGR